MLRRAAPIVAFTILVVGALTHANAGSTPASGRVARSMASSAVVPALLTRPETDVGSPRRLEVASDQGAACPGETDGELTEAAFSIATAAAPHVNPYSNLLRGPGSRQFDPFKSEL